MTVPQPLNWLFTSPPFSAERFSSRSGGWAALPTPAQGVFNRGVECLNIAAKHTLY